MTNFSYIVQFELPVYLPLVASVFLFGFLAPSVNQRSTFWRSLFAFSAFFFIARYFVWRFEGAMSGGSLYGSVILVIECLALLEVIVFLVLMSRDGSTGDMVDNFAARLIEKPVDEWPSVDILIPTYDEGPEVLEPSIIAARDVHYPNVQVWVCDDGEDRHWLKELSEKLGVGYIKRDTNEHAKAGNINHALSKTSGDLVAIFDADFAVAKNYLLRTVGLFSDPTVGVVQTPQTFFNRDPIQTNLGVFNEMADEQRLFFDHIAPSRDAWGVAFCCGAGSITRRAALEKVRGIPTGSITEDLLTTLTLLREGYRTRYVNETLAIGRAPENLEAFNVQRRRWCRGAIQTIFLKQGPLGPNLSLRDRIFYFPFGWLFQHPIRIAAILVPLIYLYFGVSPFEELSMMALVENVLPAILATTGLMLWLVPGCYVPIISAAVSLYSAIHILPTVFSSLIQPFGTPFKVTPKGNLAKSNQIDLFGLFFALGVGGLTLVGIVLSTFTWQYAHDSAAFNWVANAWGGVNIVICALVAMLAVDRKRHRRDERVSVNEQSAIFIDRKRIDVCIKDFSVSGARVFVMQPANLEVGLAVVINILGVGRVPCEVLGVRSGEVRLKFLENTSDSGDSRANLINRIFTGDLTMHVARANWRPLIKQAFANFW
ncbi:MAG: glycosyltransferase [Rhodospirillales bacterium]|nr:glycosyltransferase [Rhodospirillales bacterium]